MKHFVVIITYVKPFANFESLLPAHREHLQRGVEAGLLLVSGPQLPRTGGILIVRADSLDALEQFIAADPYAINRVATFQAIEFVPGRHQPFLADWIE